MKKRVLNTEKNSHEIETLLERFSDKKVRKTSTGKSILYKAEKGQSFRTVFSYLFLCEVLRKEGMEKCKIEFMVFAGPSSVIIFLAIGCALISGFCWGLKNGFDHNWLFMLIGILALACMTLWYLLTREELVKEFIQKCESE